MYYWVSSGTRIRGDPCADTAGGGLPTAACEASHRGHLCLRDRASVLGVRGHHGRGWGGRRAALPAGSRRMRSAPHQHAAQDFGPGPRFSQVCFPLLVDQRYNASHN